MDEIKTYFVKKSAQVHSGDLKSLRWSDAVLLTDFSYPWENERPTLLEFRALYDSEWFYCSFHVADSLASIYRAEDDKREVLFGDRVEIFLATDRSLSDYYGLEIDLCGRVYDYKAAFYRKFDDAFSWPSHDIRIEAEKEPSGYYVFLALRLTTLKEFGLLRGGVLHTGLFRGQCATASPVESEMRWISWVKPESEAPDFHLPTAFGKFIFE